MRAKTSAAMPTPSDEQPIVVDNPRPLQAGYVAGLPTEQQQQEYPQIQ